MVFFAICWFLFYLAFHFFFSNFLFYSLLDIFIWYTHTKIDIESSFFPTSNIKKSQQSKKRKGSENVRNGGGNSFSNNATKKSKKNKPTYIDDDDDDFMDDDNDEDMMAMMDVAENGRSGKSSGSGSRGQQVEIDLT